MAFAVAVAAAIVVTPGRGQDTPPGPELVVQTGHQEQVNRVAFSADSRLLASGDILAAVELAGGRASATHLVTLAASRRYLEARRKLRPRAVQ